MSDSVKDRPFIIEAQGAHGGTINHLAAEGIIKPVQFKTEDGTIYAANSVWAATDWLKAQGFYERQEPVYWLL